MNSVKQLADYLQNKKQVFFYGAGKFAKRIRKQLAKYGVIVSGYVVSERGNNPDELEGKRIWTKDELIASKMNLEELAIVVTFKGDKFDLMDQLMDCGLKNMVYLSKQFYDDLWMYERCDRYAELQDTYIFEVNYKDIEESQGVVIEKSSGLALFRAPKYHVSLEESMAKYCTRELYEKEYGRLSIISHGDEAKISDKLAKQYGAEMYVITSHLDKADVIDIRKTGYLPIQVAAALTDMRKGCITDDTGENISVKNRDYCECTGLYWIWKNTKEQNYVGMSHYRRRLMLDDEIISDLEKKHIGAVLPLPQFCVTEIDEFFSRYIGKRDWRYLKEAVIEYDAEYKVIFEEHENSHFYFPCNVFLMQREWFDKYCEFAFSVAEKVEKEFTKRGIVRQDRYMGYLFENLTSVFVKRYYKEMNIHCSEIAWIK